MLAHCKQADERYKFYEFYHLHERDNDPEGDESKRSGELNSPWRIAEGVIKYFRFDFDYVRWGISWANLLMLRLSIPIYEPADAKKDDARNVETMEDVMDLENFIHAKK